MLNTEHISRHARSGWETWLDWLFPRTCACCGRHLAGSTSGFLCMDCRQAIDWVRRPVCDTCGRPIFGKVQPPVVCPGCREHPPAFDRARSLFLHRHTGARLVHTLKYEQGIWLERELIQLAGTRTDLHAFLEHAILVPVPLHPRKLRSRGFNQADVIARAIRQAVPGVRCARLLRRMRMTPSQTFLSREERQRNMTGAFTCPQPPPGERLILVDDVLTTGATLNAAARALKQAGAGVVDAFTLAHG